MRRLALPTVILLGAAVLRLFGLATLPPGLYYDESANGIDALHVLAGLHPVFFTGDQGREPLTIYLQAVTIALVGPSMLALRLPSVALGLLTVASTYCAFSAMFGRRVGLIGMTALGVLYWHLSLSRLAFRAIALPLFVTLAVFFFHKAVQTGRRSDFALAGGLVAVDLYTYIPARLAPLLFAIWFLGCLLLPSWRKCTTRQLLQGGLAGAIIFVVVLIPLGRYFLLNPQDFIGRVATASAKPDNGSLVDGFTAATAAILESGDPNQRHDLPSKPLLALPFTLAGVLGLVLVVRRWRQNGYLLAIIWSAAMVTPAALSYEPAHALRLVGELPFLLVFPAVGLEWVSRQRWLHSTWLGSTAVALLLVGVGVTSARDYFLVWANQPLTYDVFQGDLYHSFGLLAKVPPSQTTFVTTDVYEGDAIPLAFVPHPEQKFRAFDGRAIFVRPAETSDSVYYLFARSFVPDGGIPNWIPLHEVAGSTDPFGKVDAQLYVLDPRQQLLAPGHSANAIVSDAANITGADFARTISPGETLRVALHWTVRGQLPPGDWEFFAHLVDRRQQRLLAADYNQGFPIDQWRAGDQVISWFSLPVAADAPAVVADVDFGIFDSQTGQRLPVSTPGGAPAGDRLVVGPLRIALPQSAPAPEHALVVHFGNAITLLGYDLLRPGDGSVSLRLHWRADQPVDLDYTVFAHLLDGQGKFVTAADSQPGLGELPTSTWGPGETIVDEHHLTPPAGAQTPRLEFGLYLLATGQRLPATAADGTSLGDAVTLPAP